MLKKRIFFVLFALIAVFAFTSSLSASDATKIADDVKTDVKKSMPDIKKPDVKSEMGKGMPDIKKPDVKSEMGKAIPNAAGAQKININTANAIELSSMLKKIGPKHAAAIVEYRETNGQFQSPEDIKKVKGIGDKIYELNKHIIVTTD